jgi:hypothetical protein
MEQDGGSVLLIDEIDKSEESFEALLLEVLADYQVTIPEIGTIKAQVPPLVILTSNNTRELGDALKRRCLHLHIGFPRRRRWNCRCCGRACPGLNERCCASWWPSCRRCGSRTSASRRRWPRSVDWARTLVLLHADRAGRDAGARHAERAAQARERHRRAAATASRRWCARRSSNPPERRPMDQTLAGYVRALRAAGADASTAEALDAARVVSLVGYGDRDVLKASLGVVLAKSEAEKALHEVVFERYFQAPATPSRRTRPNPRPKPGRRAPATATSTRCCRLLAQGQGGGGEQPGALERRAAARRARQRRRRHPLAWQAPFLSRRMLEAMGIAALEDRLLGKLGENTPEAADEARRLAPRATRCSAMRAASSTSATRSTAAPPPTPS